MARPVIRNGLPLVNADGLPALCKVGGCCGGHGTPYNCCNNAQTITVVVPEFDIPCPLVGNCAGLSGTFTLERSHYNSFVTGCQYTYVYPENTHYCEYVSSTLTLTVILKAMLHSGWSTYYWDVFATIHVSNSPYLSGNATNNWTIPYNTIVDCTEMIGVDILAANSTNPCRTTKPLIITDIR